MSFSAVSRGHFIQSCDISTTPIGLTSLQPMFSLQDWSKKHFTVQTGVTERVKGENTEKDKMNVKQPHPRLLEYAQNPIIIIEKNPSFLHFIQSFTETSQCIDFASSLICSLFKIWIFAVQQNYTVLNHAVLCRLQAGSELMNSVFFISPHIG